MLSAIIIVPYKVVKDWLSIFLGKRLETLKETSHNELTNFTTAIYECNTRATALQTDSRQFQEYGNLIFWSTTCNGDNEGIEG